MEKTKGQLEFQSDLKKKQGKRKLARRKLSYCWLINVSMFSHTIINHHCYQLFDRVNIVSVSN